MVTPALFARYPDARALAQATPAALEPQIVSTGFFRQKSKALIGMAQTLVAEHGGEVPADMDAADGAAGVGRKTANVVLGHALGVPGCRSIGTCCACRTASASPRATTRWRSRRSCARALPTEMWTLASDVQILHGRRICRPKPLCDECSVRDDCDYYRHVVAQRAGRTPPTREPSEAPMTRAEFERLVAEAVTLIPKRFRREMKNLALVVEDEPSAGAARGDGDRAARLALRPLSGHAAARARLGATATRCPTASPSSSARSRRTARTRTRFAR